MKTVTPRSIAYVALQVGATRKLFAFLTIDLLLFL